MLLTVGWTFCDFSLGTDCGQLSPPENGWMSGSKTSYPHNVSFTCRSGFILVGSSQRTCLRNGTWSGEEPTCLGIVKSKEKTLICG